MQLRFCDDFEDGFGWIADEFLRRCSHALVADGRVWLIDALDGNELEDRIRSAGAPAGVIQLLDPTGAVVAQTTTAANGTYSFDNLAFALEPAVAYRVREVLPAGVYQTTAAFTGQTC